MVKKEASVKNPLNYWPLVLILCFSLGLAPFFPEPHFWGKVKWVAGGANGMELLDWGDLVFHGFPWVLLIRLTLIRIKAKFSKA